MRPSTLGLWLAMYAIDPWDDNRADLRAGEIAAAVVNVQGGKKQDGTHFLARDFMPYADGQIDQEQVAIERERVLAAHVRAAFMNASGHKANKDG